MAIVLLSVGAIAVVLAFQLGRWRQGSLHRASHKGYAVPRLWRRRSVRIASWIGVSFLAMLAAGCLLVVLGPWPGLLASVFLLYGRWAASCYAAFRRIALEGVPAADAGGAPYAVRLAGAAGAAPPDLASCLSALHDEGMIGHTPVK